MKSATRGLQEECTVLTSFPKIPREQAVDTSFSPNQTAATQGDTFSMNTDDIATKVCPINVTQNKSGLTEAILMHAPTAVQNVPKMRDHRKPCKHQILSRKLELKRMH